METMFEGGVLGAVSITLSSEGRRRVYIIEMELVPSCAKYDLRVLTCKHGFRSMVSSDSSTRTRMAK